MLKAVLTTFPSIRMTLARPSIHPLPIHQHLSFPLAVHASDLALRQCADRRIPLCRVSARDPRRLVQWALLLPMLVRAAVDGWCGGIFGETPLSLLRGTLWRAPFGLNGPLLGHA